MTKCPYGYQTFSFLQREVLFFLNISIFLVQKFNIFQHLVRTKMTMLLDIRIRTVHISAYWSSKYSNNSSTCKVPRQSTERLAIVVSEPLEVGVSAGGNNATVTIFHFIQVESWILRAGENSALLRVRESWFEPDI